MIAVGFVMLFSPYTFELLACLAYLMIVGFSETKLFFIESGTHQELKTGNLCSVCNLGLRVINLALLVCALVGLSRTIKNETGNCADEAFHL
jgi:hypothetical protein